MSFSSSCPSLLFCPFLLFFFFPFLFFIFISICFVFNPKEKKIYFCWTCENWRMRSYCLFLDLHCHNSSQHVHIYTAAAGAGCNPTCGSGKAELICIVVWALRGHVTFEVEGGHTAVARNTFLKHSKLKDRYK